MKKEYDFSQARKNPFAPKQKNQTGTSVMLTSARLTATEIEDLRQKKRLISEYVQRELQGSLGQKIAAVKKSDHNT